MNLVAKTAEVELKASAMSDNEVANPKLRIHTPADLLLLLSEITFKVYKPYIFLKALVS